MTVSVTHDRETKKMLFEIGRHPFKHQRALKLAFNEIGSEVVNKIANYIFNGPKTGRIYTFRGRQHQASAPGESPANRTGKLAKSSDYKVRSAWEMVIGETAEYAKYLEEGTENIMPRPHIIRAVNANHRDAVRAIEENIDREIKK